MTVPGLLLGHVADYFTGLNAKRIKCVCLSYMMNLRFP